MVPNVDDILAKMITTIRAIIVKTTILKSLKSNNSHR